MKSSIHVVLASDNYYFPYVYVAIKTLFQSNIHIEKLVVHYIEQDVDKENLNQLIILGEKYDRSIDIIKFNMPKEFYDVLPAFGVASKTTYAKFWFSSMFPNEDRVLYLDPDVLVLSGIEELYNVNLNNNLIAGVIENLPYYHMDASNMSKDDAYINGGMVLCNLKAWREYNLEAKALVRLKDTRHNLNYDQGILNELCKDHIFVLPPKYNVLAEVFEFKERSKIIKRYGFTHYYSQEELDEAIKNPTIVHFTGFLYGKPMSRKCDHPYAQFFQTILSESNVKYDLNSQDINIKKKLRKFFLRKMPFQIYLTLEKILDIRREYKL